MYSSCDPCVTWQSIAAKQLVKKLKVLKKYTASTGIFSPFMIGAHFVLCEALHQGCFFKQTLQTFGALFKLVMTSAVNSNFSNLTKTELRHSSQYERSIKRREYSFDFWACKPQLPSCALGLSSCAIAQNQVVQIFQLVQAVILVCQLRFEQVVEVVILRRQVVQVVIFVRQAVQVMRFSNLVFDKLRSYCVHYHSFWLCLNFRKSTSR